MNSTGKHSVVLVTFILQLENIVLFTIERQTFGFPVESQLMFDINIFTELIVQYHRHKASIDYSGWGWKYFLTAQIFYQSQHSDNS